MYIYIDIIIYIYTLICKLHHTCTVVDFMVEEFRHVWPEHVVKGVAGGSSDMTTRPEFVAFFLVGKPQDQRPATGLIEKWGCEM